MTIAFAAWLCERQLAGEMKRYLVIYEKALESTLNTVDLDLQSLVSRLNLLSTSISDTPQDPMRCDQGFKESLQRAAIASLLVKEFAVHTAGSDQLCASFGLVPALWTTPTQHMSHVLVLPLQRIQSGFVVVKEVAHRGSRSHFVGAVIDPRQILDRLPLAPPGQFLLIKALDGRVIAGQSELTANSLVSGEPFTVKDWPIRIEARLQTGYFMSSLLAQWPLMLLIWFAGTAAVLLSFNRHYRRISSRSLRLERALKKRRFAPVVQPIVDAKTQACVGVEILMRWKHPLRGLIAPAEFIDYAERSGLIVPMSDLLMRLAHRQLSEIAIAYPHLYFSFNVTPTQLRTPNFAQSLLDIFDGQPIGPSRVLLELTERDLVDDQICIEMARLRAHGFSIAIDDFGTGQSSLAVLQNLVIDKLKIDRAFVSTVSDKADGQPVLDAIVTLAHRLNLTMVAEGIETPAQRDYLSDKGVQSLQGYLFSRPLTPLDFSTWLAQRTHANLNAQDNSVVPIQLRLKVDVVMRALSQARSALEANRWHQFRRYPQCLLGNELVTWMSDHYQCTRAQALVIGQRLVARGLLVHVMEEHDFEDQPFFYRLVPLEATTEISAGRSESAAGPKQWLGWLQGRHGVVAGDRYAGLLKYRDVVSGKEIVDALVRAGGLSHAQASIAGVQMMRAGMVRHTFDERGFVDSDRHHYHFSN